METKLKKIFETQKEFQKLVGFPIDSNLEKDRNEISEKYLFKLIEEVVEARKEFPSVMNPWSKTQARSVNFEKLHKEFSDIFLFLINVLITWKLDFPEFLKITEKVQLCNIENLKKKKMSVLNDEILSIPTYLSGVGQGNITPKYIFIGQNPGKNITHGYEFWSNPNDGSSKILLPLLEKMGILKDCYFTNVVKSTTVDNIEPNYETTDFWLPFFKTELDILTSFNSNYSVIAMGKWTSEILTARGYMNKFIYHPAALNRGFMNIPEYAELIKKELNLEN